MGWKTAQHTNASRVFATAVVLSAVVLLVSCPTPLTLDDGLDRDLDRPLAGEAVLASSSGDYDTEPTWTWTGDPEEGAGVFRYRLNGGGWSEPTTDTSYTVPPPGIFPGVHLFEVQERNAAGIWSSSARLMKTIKVREPVFVPGGVPVSPTNNPTPEFLWQQFSPPQYGATDRYSWRLQVRSGDDWVPVEDESGDGEAGVTSYLVSAPLADGTYRFGVAEWNEGGERSDFVSTVFVVDATPPGSPTITGPSIVSDASGTTSVFSLTPDTDDTFSEFLFELLDADGLTAGASGTTSDSTLSIPLSSVSGGPGLGTYTLEVRQRDAAANVGVPAIFVVSVEAIPNLVLIGAPLTNNTTPEFEITGNDPGNLDNFFRWVINGTPTGGDFTGPIATAFIQTIPAQTDGTWEIAVQQRRTDLSYTAASPAVTMTIDTTPPLAPVFTVTPPSPTNIATPSFTVTGEAGGTFVYSISGATTIPDSDVPDTGADGVETIVLPLLNDGSNTVSVFQRDLAGNDGPAADFTVIVDTTPPPSPTGLSSPDLLGTPPNQYVQTGTPLFTWIGSGEPGATWEYSLDGGTSWTGTAVENASLALVTGTNYQMVVREIDQAGNVSGSTAPITFDVVDGGSSIITIDNPTVPTFSIANGGVTLDRSVPDAWNLEAVPGMGVTITAFEWLVNGVSKSVAQNFTLNSTDVDTNLGANTLTLFVEINGMWYSDNFVFQVVEN